MNLPIEDQDECLRIWTENRRSYPGWLVLPEENRQELESQLRHHSLADSLLWGAESNWAIDKQLNAWFELNWQLERLLLPLQPEWATRISAVLSKTAPFPQLNTANQFFAADAASFVERADLREPWRDLALALLRHYREFRQQAQFDVWCARLNPLKVDEVEVEHQLSHQTALWHVTFRNDEAALQALDNWCVERSGDPFWQARKAALLAELGRSEDALECWRRTLLALQSQRTQEQPFYACSREAWIQAVLQQAAHVVVELDRDAISERLRALTSVDGTAPWREVHNLSVPNREYREKQAEMEANPQTIYLLSHSMWKPQEAVQCFRLCEEAGLPLQIPGPMNIRTSAGAALDESLEDLALASEQLAGTCLLRHRGSSYYDKWLDASHVAAMPMELLIDLRISCGVLWSTIQVGAPVEAYVWASRLNNLIALLKVVHWRFDDGERLEWLGRLLSLGTDARLARDPHAAYQAQEGIEFLAKVLPPERVADVLPTALAFPLPEETPRPDPRWPEPFQSLRRPFPGGPPPQLNRSRIDQLISLCQASEHALIRLTWLHQAGLLDGNHQSEFARVLWQEGDALPNIHRLAIPYVLTLPEAAPGQAANAVSASLLTGPPPLRQPDGRIVMSLGNDWFRDLSKASAPYRTENASTILWSEAEAETLLGLIEHWWEREHDAVAQREAALFSFKDRMYWVVRALARAIAPKLGRSSEAGRKRLPRLLDGISAAGYHTLTAAPMVLRFRIADADQTATRLADALRSPDSDVVDDALWGLIHWWEFQEAAKLPAPPHRLIEQLLVSIVAPGDGKSGTQGIGAMEFILSKAPGTLSNRARDLLGVALVSLQAKATYPSNWHDRNRWLSADVPELRRNCALLAVAAAQAGYGEEPSVQEWLLKAKDDPLPFVRQALAPLAPRSEEGV